MIWYGLAVSLCFPFFFVAHCHSFLFPPQNSMSFVFRMLLISQPRFPLPVWNSIAQFLDLKTKLLALGRLSRALESSFQNPASWFSLRFGREVSLVRLQQKKLMNLDTWTSLCSCWQQLRLLDLSDASFLTDEMMKQTGLPLCCEFLSLFLNLVSLSFCIALYCRSLRSLSLSACRGLQTFEFIELMAGVPLAELDLSKCRLSAPIFQQRVLSKLSALQRLNISDCGLAGKDLVPRVMHRTLTTLEASNVYWEPSDLLLFLALCPGIRNFILSMQAGFPSLASQFAQICPFLQSLTITAPAAGGPSLLPPDFVSLSPFSNCKQLTKFIAHALSPIDGLNGLSQIFFCFSACHNLSSRFLFVSLHSPSFSAVSLTMPQLQQVCLLFALKDPPST